MQAIQAAKNQEWQKALDYNTQIIEIDNKDIAAFNRLGLAQLQLGGKKQAIEAFQSALGIDKSNNIANKHLKALKKNQNIKVPAFSTSNFIEEPGKTKTVELHRLACKDLLNELNVGTLCQLVPKNRYISIEANSKYIGALPEDLSFRLTKLIKTGNDYICQVRSVSSCNCVVFLKETKRSKRNQNINSFPLVKTKITTINDVDDTFLKDDVPVQIVETDNDNQQNFEFVINNIDDED